MYLDEGRKADLKHIRQTLDDPKVSRDVKEKARRAQAQILSQSEAVAKERQRLINARKAGDQDAAERIMMNMETM